MADIVFGPDDPTVFAKCSGYCSRTGVGSTINRLFLKAYPRRKWVRKPVCDNCKRPMVKLYEVKEERRERRPRRVR